MKLSKLGWKWFGSINQLSKLFQSILRFEFSKMINFFKIKSIADETFVLKGNKNNNEAIIIMWNPFHFAGSSGSNVINCWHFMIIGMYTGIPVYLVPTSIIYIYIYSSTWYWGTICRIIAKSYPDLSVTNFDSLKFLNIYSDHQVPQ